MSEFKNSSVMEKIRKCLALSESSNEHEAAAAMRQARKLMEKHGLSADAMNLFKIKEETMSTKYSNPPLWFLMLAQVIANAFQCSLYTTHKKFIFVGKDACAEVARYSFDVLHRQLVNHKNEFLNSDRVIFAAASVKRKVGQAFCEGWISNVGTKVDEFASRLTDEESNEHTEYLKTVTQKEIGEKDSSNKRRKEDPVKNWAAAHGWRSGENVNLHEGVAAGEQSLRLSGSVHESKVA